MTEEHFLATLIPDAEAVQNPVQQASAMLENDQNGESGGKAADPENPVNFQGSQESAMPLVGVGCNAKAWEADGEGFEPPVGSHPLRFSRPPQ